MERYLVDVFEKTVYIRRNSRTAVPIVLRSCFSSAPSKYRDPIIQLYMHVAVTDQMVPCLHIVIGFTPGIAQIPGTNTTLLTRRAIYARTTVTAGVVWRRKEDRKHASGPALPATCAMNLLS